MQETLTIMVSSRHGAAPEAVEIPRRVGHVRLGDVLGEGAGGIVLTGFDEVLNRRVAVKLLRPQADGLNPAATTEIVSGLRAAAAIKHPNIVVVHSVDNVGEMPVVVMEHIDGISMRELLRRTGALDVPLALHLLRSVISGVEALHNASVVHRDLKPANVLLDREGRAFVCDFGLACGFDAGRREGMSDTIGGSPLYMAPEMFDGHVSPQSDVYALGVMLFEALAGRAPFVADTIGDLTRLHRAGRPPLQLLEKRNIPADLTQVIERALHTQRIMRFKTAGHLGRALTEFAAQGRDEALRMKLADVASAQRRPVAAAPAPAAPVEMTTFDLIARRAAEKREARKP